MTKNDVPALTVEEATQISFILKQPQYSRKQAQYVSEIHQKYTGKSLCLTCGNKMRNAMRYLLGDE